VLLELSRLPEALQDVETALGLSPEDPRALHLRGSIHREGNDLARAESDFRRALALDPSMVDTARDLAVLLMETGHSSEAVEVLKSTSRGSR
jgi:Flp pilus assembly protein TadD